MRMSLPFAWEKIYNWTYRSKVPGGWLVLVDDAVKSGCMTFISDQNHEWVIEEQKPDPKLEQANLAADFEPCKF